MAVSNRIRTGMSRTRLARLIEEMAAPWAAAEQDRLLARRGHERLRAAGAGPGHDLPFTDGSSSPSFTCGSSSRTRPWP